MDKKKSGNQPGTAAPTTAARIAELEIELATVRVALSGRQVAFSRMALENGRLHAALCEFGLGKDSQAFPEFTRDTWRHAIQTAQKLYSESEPALLALGYVVMLAEFAPEHRASTVDPIPHAAAPATPVVATTNVSQLRLVPAVGACSCGASPPAPHATDCPAAPRTMGDA